MDEKRFEYTTKNKLEYYKKAIIIIRLIRNKINQTIELVTLKN